MHYFYLALAVLGEVIGTSFLKATEDFTKLWPSLIVVLGYGAAFYFLTLSLKVIPVGIAYATWSVLGLCWSPSFRFFYTSRFLTGQLSLAWQ